MKNGQKRNVAKQTMENGLTSSDETQNDLANRMAIEKKSYLM